jgi:CheY-like chemotaxis protein
VLVVDDNLTNRLILPQSLVGWRTRPTLAAGGQQAVISDDDRANCGLSLQMQTLEHPLSI